MTDKASSHIIDHMRVFRELSHRTYIMSPAHDRQRQHMLYYCDDKNHTCMAVQCRSALATSSSTPDTIEHNPSTCIGRRTYSIGSLCWPLLAGDRNLPPQLAELLYASPELVATCDALHQKDSPAQCCISLDLRYSEECCIAVTTVQVGAAAQSGAWQLIHSAV